MSVQLGMGTVTSPIWALLMPPIVSFVTMSSLLFLVYGTLGTWVLAYTDWEVIYDNRLALAMGDTLTAFFCERRPRLGSGIACAQEKLKHC